MRNLKLSLVITLGESGTAKVWEKGETGERFNGAGDILVFAQVSRIINVRSVYNNIFIYEILYSHF